MADKKKELISSVNKLVEAKKSIEGVFKNQELLKGEQNMKYLTYAKRVGRTITIIGGTLSIVGSATGSAVKCSSPENLQTEKTLSVTGSAVGGSLAIIGSSIEWYASEKKEVLDKYFKDLKDLKDNWNNLVNIFKGEDLYSLHKEINFSPSIIDNTLQEFFESYNNLESAKERVRQSNEDFDDCERWLSSPISKAISLKEKVEMSKKHSQVLQQIWQEWSIGNKIDKLKKQVNDHSREISWKTLPEKNKISESNFQEQQGEVVAEASSSVMNNNQSNFVIEVSPKGSISSKT